MANPFEILVSNLNQLGFFGFLLPWLLMFALVFGLLSKTKILGEDKKIIGVISLVIAFFMIGYGGPAVGLFFVNLFGVASLVLGGILVIILFVAMAGGDFGKLMENKALAALVAGVGLIVFFMVLGTAFGVAMTSDTVAAIFIVLVIALAVMFIAGGS